MSDLKSMIHIICHRSEYESFVNSICPERFNDEWDGLYSSLCEATESSECMECWNKYVEWEIIDEVNA